MTPERYLELQFIKGIRKGYLTNAELSPPAIEELRPCLSSDERCIVAVQDKTGGRLWFTNQRLFLQNESGVITLFEYQDVQHVHWMFKDYFRNLRPPSPLPDEEAARTKMEHFDRLEVELKGGGASMVTIEGLNGAYQPIFQFLQFLTQPRPSS